ncbi:hypothetical protein D3C75_1030350 [compost metagenome]
MVFFTECGNQLIHNPAVAADELVFRFLTIERQCYAIQRQGIQRLHGLANGNFQRGRRTETGALRHITGNHQIRAAKVGITLLQVFDHSAYIIGPTLIRMADDRAVQ